MMAKSLGSELSEPLDPAASREERRATGRMVAVIVALLMIFSGFYHAWIKRIPVLAGVMVPALIMLLYAAWVLFLAKREKKRRLNAENHMRSSMTALSDILVMPPSTAGAATELRRLSHCSGSERRPSHSGGGISDRRLSHSSTERMRIQPSALQLMLLHQQHQLHLQQQQQIGAGRRSHRKDRHHHHHHHRHRRSSAVPPGSAERHHLMLAKRPSLVPDIVVTPMTPPIFEEQQRRPSLVRSMSTR